MYPPDAPTSSTKASTGIFFSSASCRIRRKMRCDCDGEPPGELMTKASARVRGIAKARSNDLAIVESSSPGRRGVTTPMTPARRTTGTTGMSVRNRRGTSRAVTLTRRAPKLSRDGGVELGIYPDTQPGLLKSKAKGSTRDPESERDALNPDDPREKHPAL